MDRERAVLRRVSLVTTQDMHEWVKAGVGAVVVIGFLLFAALLVFHSLPVENDKAITIMFGSISTLAGAVVNYYFGSSRSSQTKDDTINKLSGGR